MSESTPGKTALVIGGGIGGLAAISGLRKLDKNVNIVLVEPKDHVELYWATYRSPFEDWVAQGSLITLSKYCDDMNVRHVQDALVTKLDQNKAVLCNGDEITFDVCTVAVGAASQWPAMGRGPPAVSATADSSSGSSSASATKEDRLKVLKAEGERILNSSSVLIVGGGLIGTELAGDVAAYATKTGKSVQVTLVHSKEQLCPEMSESAAKKVQSKMEKLGVNVILNEKAVAEGDGKTVVLQKSKKELTAETIIFTNGFIPVNGFLKDLPGALDDKGWIQTDKYFRIQGGGGRLFAIGDCATTLPNAGNQYMRNSSIIGRNLKATLDGVGEKESKLKEVSHGLEMYVNTVGPNGGVAYSSLFWTQYLLPWLKNATMFLFSPKSELGIRE